MFSGGVVLGERASLVHLLGRIGMPWTAEPYRHERWHGWDGVALNLACRSDTSSVIHEIAHWLVAIPERRHLADFGLQRLHVPCVRKRWFPWGTHYGDDEECVASLLGILIERHLGFNWQDTWAFHNWDENIQPGKSWFTRGYFRALQRGGFLHGLTPTCFLVDR